MFLALFVYGLTLAAALVLCAAIWRNDGPRWAMLFAAVVIFAALM